MRTIRFVNPQSHRQIPEFQISEDGIPPVMAWYGGFHAGDDYKVYVDGVEVQHDRNGELVGDLP